jgi:hypothetical protein
LLRYQDDPLLPECPRKDIVDLIEHENMDINGTHQPECDLLEIDHRGPRVLWCAQCRQDLRVQAALSRFPRHLQGQNPGPLDPSLTIEPWRMIAAKLLHDHRLAHAAVAVDGDARHASGAWVIEQTVEDLEHLAGARVVHPAFGEYRAYSISVRFREKLRRGGSQMRGLSGHAMSPNLPPRQSPCASRCP